MVTWWPPCQQTDTGENIAFPQLRWRAVIKLWALLSAGMWTTMRKGWKNEKLVQVSHKIYIFFISIIRLVRSFYPSILHVFGAEDMCCENVIISKFQSISWNAPTPFFQLFLFISFVQMEVRIVCCFEMKLKCKWCRCSEERRDIQWTLGAFKGKDWLKCHYIFVINHLICINYLNKLLNLHNLFEKRAHPIISDKAKYNGVIGTKWSFHFSNLFVKHNLYQLLFFDMLWKPLCLLSTNLKI